MRLAAAAAAASASASSASLRASAASPAAALPAAGIASSAPSADDVPAGLPPFAGAWSKWYLVLGAIEAEHYFAVGVLVLSSLLNIAYLLPVAVSAFFPGDGESGGGVHEAPLACLVPLLLTALACLALFLYPDPVLDLVRLIGEI